MSASTSTMRYSFGRNWKRFVRYSFSDERVTIAQQHMLEFLSPHDIEGSDFLDVGCGSGIHSLAALRAGARRIVSFDFDSNSVAATMNLWRAAGRPAHWTIQQGDVLDERFLQSLGAFPIVYSWGVLHHTGDVWRAFRNAQTCVAAGGLFYVALYSADAYGDTTAYWLDIKQRYNSAGFIGRRRMEWSYIWEHMLLRDRKNLPELIDRFRNYKRSRGMSAMTDIRDWLGGWPMEFVQDADVIAAAERVGLSLAKISAGQANTEFLFTRPGSDLMADSFNGGRRRIPDRQRAS